MKDISINLNDLRNVKGFGPKMEEKVLDEEIEKRKWASLDCRVEVLDYE